MAALLAFAGCADDDVVKTPSRPQGATGIVFGASASYGADHRTRTVYGDYDSPTNPTKQEINWVVGDSVMIYSPQAPSSAQVGHYRVYNIGPKENLAQLAGEKGVQWASPVGTMQDFYAVYPDPQSMSNQSFVNRYGIKFEDGKLYGFVPVNQQHTIVKNGDGSYTATCNMDYSYMTAHTSSAVPEMWDAGTNLYFKPVTTTLEITLVGGDTPQKLTSLNVSSTDGTPIIGKFICDLSTQTANDPNAYPECQYNTDNNIEGTRVTIPLYDKDGDPVELQSGQTITFNMFLLPHEDLSNLSVTVVGLNDGSKRMPLNYHQSAPIILPAHKKTRVKLKVPEFSGTNNWMANIGDNVLISQLSIPGTANSYSYNYSGSHEEMYRTQLHDIDAQWNAGIRCFELKLPNNARGNSLKDVELQCNGQNLGITFGQAVQAIWQKVNGSNEFAMIIPFFESQAGRDGVVDFANDLNRFFTDHREYKYVTYRGDLTLGEARNSLMFIARTTSEEDYENFDPQTGYTNFKTQYGTMPQPREGVFVDQWGSLKDNWWRRGYTINGTPVQNWAKKETYVNPQSTPTMEYYMMNGNTSESSSNNNWTPSQFPEKVEANINYMHTTTRANGTPGHAYIQDWSRVVDETHNFQVGYDEEGWLWPTPSTYYFCYWKESYSEKIGDVWRTFNLAIEDNRQEGGGSTFYINSLDGYFVDWTDAGSDGDSPYPFVEGGDPIGMDNSTKWSGGGRGDIAAYAEQINNDFYRRILSFGENNIYGSMNIVILDRVLEGRGGQNLPQVIINNNFRFPLQTKASQGGN